MRCNASFILVALMLGPSIAILGDEEVRAIYLFCWSIALVHGNFDRASGQLAFVCLHASDKFILKLGGAERAVPGRLRLTRKTKQVLSARIFGINSNKRENANSFWIQSKQHPCWLGGRVMKSACVTQAEQFTDRSAAAKEPLRPFPRSQILSQEPHPFPGECYTLCSCWMTIFACESRMIDDADQKLASSSDGGGESRRRRSAATRDLKSIFVWAPISNRPGMHRTVKRSSLHRRYLSRTSANYPFLIYSPHLPCDAYT